MLPSSNSLPRRKFITLNGLLAAGTFLGFGLQKGWSQVVQQTQKVLRVVAGFTGPRYYGAEEKEGLLQVVESRYPFRYKGHTPTQVRLFEQEFTTYMGSTYCLAVTSGTAALNCAMAALGVGPGDEVIVPACTWWSDYTTVVQAGALPVFADIDTSLNIDPADVERKISPRTKAIIVVHLLGSSCNMDALMDLARRYRLQVVEDCAQSPGATYKGQKLGTLGDIGIYSFNIYKLMTAGEGGALVTHSEELFFKAARYHDMGYLHRVFDMAATQNLMPECPGENYRMSEFTGAVLRAQLPKLDTMIRDLRQRKKVIYQGIAALSGIAFRHYDDAEGETGAYIHLLLPDSTSRDRWLEALQAWQLPVTEVSGSVVLPIQESVLNKRTRHPQWPSFSTPEGKSIVYGPESCQPTLDVYNRMLQLNVGAGFTPDEIRYCIASIQAVADTLRGVHS